MTDDLVKRLRQPCQDYLPPRSPHFETMREAADRLEAAEAELKEKNDLIERMRKNEKVVCEDNAILRRQLKEAQKVIEGGQSS